jgi:TolB-like protein/DNA-binding winged helix-turn-helix (wHTH) protein
MNPTRVFRFATFEVDLDTAELRRQGLRIKLQDKPFQVLALLLERHGSLVTREELRQRLWAADTFVDFDAGLNTALNKLRAALCDAADSPDYIETIPRQGYRFIAPLAPLAQLEPAANLSAAGASTAASTDRLRPTEITPSQLDPQWNAVQQNPSSPAAESSSKWPRNLTIALAAAALLIVSSLIFARTQSPKLKFSPAPANAGDGRMKLLVLPFDNIGGDPTHQPFVEDLTDDLTAQLGGVSPGQIGVVSRNSAEYWKNSHKPLDQMVSATTSEYIVEGCVHQNDGKVRVMVTLIDAHDQCSVWAETYERNMSGDAWNIQHALALAICADLAAEIISRSKSAASLKDRAPSPH